MGAASRKPGQLRLVLFDLDGTFADTLPGLTAALNAALAETGLGPVEAADLRRVVSLGTRAIVGLAVGDERRAVDEAALRERFLEHYARESSSGAHARVFPGIEKVLEALASRGLRWGIVTNKLERFARPLVERLDPQGVCACVVGGDGAPHPKPHPAPLLLACREAAVAPFEALYVGDAEGDVVAGRRAGMRTVAAAYGYLVPGADPGGWGASAVIDSPLALLGWLDRTQGARE